MFVSAFVSDIAFKWAINENCGENKSLSADK